MNRPNHLYKLLPLLLALFGCWPYCQWGGGMASGSVTVPGPDGVFVKAETTSGDRTARLELERTTTEVTRGHEVTYLFAKTLVRQELRLIIGAGGPDRTFIVAEHDAASSHPSHAVEFSPDGQRLGYRLGEEPWRVVYLLTREHAIHGPGEFSTLDWAAVPTLDAAFVDVYRAQMLMLGGKFSFERIPLLLTWARMRGGEAGLADRLFDLIPLRDHTWDTQVLETTDGVRSRLRERLRKVVESGAATAEHWSKAWSVGAIDLDAERDQQFAEPGARALAASEDTVINNGVDLARYLSAWAGQDASAAATVACGLVRPDDPPYALDRGRPAALVALATLTTAKSVCPAVERVSVDACAADVRCGAQACTAEQLRPLAREVLGRRWKDPAAGDTPEDPLTGARLALAYRAAMGNYTPPACAN